MTSARTLANALIERGLTSATAEALARVVVDPGAVLRRLKEPIEHRTAAGTVLTVPATVWTPAVSVYPDNKRDAVERPLPISPVALSYPPLRELASEGDRPYLTLVADSREQLAAALIRSEANLITLNSLEDKLRGEGILRPITAIALTVSFPDGSELSIVTSADGSSRIASAHRILGIRADQVAYQLAQDDVNFQAFVDTVTNSDGLDARRVLMAPAELVIGIRPNAPAPDSAARVIRAFVGLLHVQPPTAWTAGAQLDAQADEVLADLLDARAIDDDLRSYLAGTITLAEAAERGLPAHPDERAATVVAIFRDHASIVRDAIRRITHAARVSNARLASVAAELAARTFRNDPDHATLESMSRSRVGLQLAYRLKEIWSGDWENSDRDPEELYLAAREELDRADLGPARMEMAVKGGFELARLRVLAQYSLRKGVLVTNLASPAAILRTLTSSDWGLRVLRDAIIAGRNLSGSIARTPEIPGDGSGRAHAMDADWLRSNFDPAAAPPPLPDPGPIPERVYEEAVDHIRALIHALDAAFDTARSVDNEAGQLLDDIVGWPPEDAREFGAILSRLRDELNSHVYRRRRGMGESLSAEPLLPAPPDDDGDWE